MPVPAGALSHRIAIALFTCALGACGGGGHHDGPPPQDTTGLAPVADAGNDQMGQGGLPVQLTASGSYDPDGTVVSYHWEQAVSTGDTPVVLSGSDSSTATFTPPAVNNVRLYTFVLTVTDNDGMTATDWVQVNVPDQTPTPSPSGISILSPSVKDPVSITVSGTHAFFAAYDDVDGAYNQVWVTDGTTTGTTLLKDFSSMMDVGGFVPFKNGVVFRASDPGVSDALWFSDGTVAGTKMLSAISGSNYVASDDNHYYFMADDGTHGDELWASDGTAAGTYLVKDRNPGTARTKVYAASSTIWNGKLYFYADDDNSDLSFTWIPQLYVTDGSPGNMQQLTTSTWEDASLLNYQMVAFQNKLYFTWHSQANGRELWSTDGTAVGTALFVDLDPSVDGYGFAADSWPTLFNVLGDKLLFFAYYGSSFRSLWSSDGTVAGTRMVRESEAGVLTDRMVLMDGKYYFAGRTPDYVNLSALALWSTDGTTAGTQEVSTAVRPMDDLQSVRMVVLGTGQLLFMGDDGATGNEPWISDGTAAGTFALTDIFPGSSSSLRTTSNVKFTVRNGKAYFVARIATNDYQLFETDGTTAGTVRLAPSGATVTVNPMGQPGFISSTSVPVDAPVLLGNTLLFRGNYTGTFRLYRD